ncbi:MAG TPA: hypothetical protein DEO92_02690 [Phycisphaerales bacterium]|nr:hypothetical protein [Phycisphaerales bacterium]
MPIGVNHPRLTLFHPLAHVDIDEILRRPRFARQVECAICIQSKSLAFVHDDTPEIPRRERQGQDEEPLYWAIVSGRLLDLAIQVELSVR